jgi:hypothetical protein
MKNGVTTVIDQVSRVVKGINTLATTRTLVGVPAEKAGRSDDGSINNAALAYIHDNGAPEANIPARPFMRPGIKNAQEKITDQFQKTAEAAVDKGPETALRGFARAGMIAQASIRAAIGSNIPPPLQPATIRNRQKGRRTKGMRKSETEYGALVTSGVAPGEAQSTVGIVALVNTGQLRNAINYVVRKVR